MNIRRIVTFITVLSILLVSACTPQERVWQTDQYFARILPSNIGTATDNVTDGYFHNLWVDNIFGSANGTGNITAVTATLPLTSSGGTTPNISISTAGAASDGALTSIDWNIFNNKQSLLTVGNLNVTSPLSANATRQVIGGEVTLSIDSTAFASNSTGQVMPDQQALQYKGAGYLTNPVANFRSTDSKGSVEGWDRTATLATLQTLFSSCDEAVGTQSVFDMRVTAGNKLAVVHRIGGGAANEVDGNTVIADGLWFHWVISSNDTAWQLYVNGVLQTLTGAGGTNTGDWFAEATGRDNISIGVSKRSTLSNFLNGDGGILRIYSVPLTPAEILQNYQRGRKAVTVNPTNMVFNLNLTEQSGNPVDKVGSLTMPLSGTTLPVWLNSDRVFAAVGKTVQFNSSVTFTGTDGTTMTTPGTSQTLAGVGMTNNWTASQNMTGNKITNLAAPTANGDAVRYENLTLPNATLTSSANQSSGGTTTANNVTFNSNDQLVGITHSTSSNTSQVWIQQSGAYLITFSAMFDVAIPVSNIAIWYKKNGTNIANSNTGKVIHSATEEQLITVTWIGQASAGDYFEIAWWSDDAGTQLRAQLAATAPTRPASPSVILTINKVSN